MTGFWDTAEDIYTIIKETIDRIIIPILKYLWSIIQWLRV